MPIVKHIAIHQYPMKLIEYVMRGDKTDECKFVDGLNCTADEESCFEEMRTTYETFKGERFYKRSLDYIDEEKRKKENVRLHHYIQSFSPGEVTPEEAHRIGLEWAEKVFGKNHQVLVSTHVDRGHIHTHFVVSAFSLDGKRWLGNKKSLDRCRSISDKIAKEHGLSIIENPKDKKSSITYTEWLARQNKSSWKTKLCDDIDNLIMQENVNSINDLAEELKQKGYIINLGKYMSVKASAKCRRAIRTRSLGDGYSVEELAYRIQYKHIDMNLQTHDVGKNLQSDYAIYLREIQILKFRNPKQSPVRYYDLLKTSELLTYLYDNNIKSASELESHVNAADEKYKNLKNQKSELLKKLEFEKKLIADSDEYLELKNKPDLTSDDIKRMRSLKYLYDHKIENRNDVEAHVNIAEALKQQIAETDSKLDIAAVERKTAADKYKLYTNQAQSDFDIILNKLRDDEQRKEENIKTENTNRYEHTRY